MTTIDQPEKSRLSEYDLSWDRWLTHAYTLNWEVAIYVLIFLLAIFSRFYELGDRVMSHDESLHTYYSWRLYDAGDFQHTPLMHGPLLFHATAFFYFLFGDSDFSARIYPALLGVAMVIFPYLFRRWLGRIGAVLASIGILISPMILYYNRYIRHDTPTMFFALVMIYAMLRYLDGERHPKWLWVFSGGMLGMLASKEVAFIYIAIIGSFLLVYWLLRVIQDAQTTPLPEDTLPLGGILALLGGIVPGATLYAALRGHLRPLGHVLIAGTAVLLGYFGGELLYLWQFAEMTWTWVVIGVVMVLFVRLIPLVWDMLRRAFQNGYSQDIANAALVLGGLAGSVFLLWGIFAYTSADNQLDKQLAVPDETANVFVRQGNEQDIETLESNRQTGAIAAAVGLLMMVSSLGVLTVMNVFAKTSNPEDPTATTPISQTWFINTLLVMVLIALVLALMRLLTGTSFESTGVIKLLLMMVIFAGLESVGFIRTFIAQGEPQAGVAQMFANGLSNAKSISMVIFAGTLLGGAIAVYIFGVTDIIKPEQVWVEVTPPAVQTDTATDGDLSINPETGESLVDTAVNSQPQESRIEIDTRLGNALLMWVGLPILGAVLLVFLVAIFKTPAALPLPWSDILAVLLVALIVGSAFVFIERHSLETNEEATEEPSAIDPTEQATTQDTQSHDNLLILGSLTGILTLTLLVIAWRVVFPEHWEYFNRQPAFDILIMLGTLIIPWLTAVPVFSAGYVLDQAPLPSDTLRVSFPIMLALIGLAAAVGVSWNWRAWLIGFVVFIGLFMFFFTTVFTNGQGVFTGMVGSLGYWLEQQGVRRGSQPQYYYTLIQIPVYEFMPAILALMAGVAGLSRLFAWRNESLQLEAEAEFRRELGTVTEPTEKLDMEAVIAAQKAHEERAISDDFAMPEFEPTSSLTWARPYDHQEELALREGKREWLGELPFMQFVGYWAIVMLAGLTIAGEKMPWLTVHITLPLIFISGWYVGGIVEKIDWNAVRKGGWALIICLVPVFIVALMRVMSPLMGGDQPFRGKAQAELSATNEWLAALVVLIGVGYFIYRLGQSLGLAQTRRLAFTSVAILLAALTTRAAVMAAFQNYDYPTEYLVYAHSGPAVKLTLDEIAYLADRTNEGLDMKIAYDDDSSWPMTWYLRHYNSAFFAGEASDIESNPSALEGARVVVVGNRKNDAVERILGDEYYRFDYKRLWWPMQAYFGLSFDRVANIFDGGDDPDAALYREGIWDIWWNRDYTEYGIAQCVEGKAFECSAETDANKNACYQRIQNDCKTDERYSLNQWPVSDSMYVYIDKEIAAEIWDAGIGGETVAAREPLDAIDRVFRNIEPLTTFGQDVTLNSPRGAAVAPNGDIYVADTNNSRIVVFDETGAFVNTFGIATTAENNAPGTLNQPWGVAIGKDGNVYVADTWNHRVQVYSPDGQIINSWGSYGSDVASGNPNTFYGPRAIAIDMDGNVLVADTGNKRIRVYSSEGFWLRDIGTSGTGLGQLDEPAGLAVNPINGDIYVADTWNRRIQVFSADGIALREWEVPMWFDNRTSPDRPYLAISPDGSLLAVSDMTAAGRNDGPRVVVYDLAGNPVLAFNAPETDFTAGLHGVRIVAGLAFAPDGSLVVVDAESNRVVKFPPLPVTGSLLPSPRDSVVNEGDADIDVESDSGGMDGESSDDDQIIEDAAIDAIQNEDDGDAPQPQVTDEVTDDVTDEVTDEVTEEAQG